MKKNHQVVLFSTILLSVTFLYGFYIHNKRAAVVVPGFAVVELFTSEGCSSCPAADALACVIAGENPANVYILSFHVDYWDRLGWKDMFSNSQYSERQKQYAGIFGLKSIYTPQMIVNGETEFVGSDEKRLRRTIQTDLKNAAVSVLDINATITDAKTVLVSCTTNNTNKIIYNFALVQKYAEASVKKGENAGRQLKHFNIVRDFKKITGNPNKAGNVTLLIPAGMTPKDFNVIAFAQNPDNFKIVAAAQKVLL